MTENFSHISNDTPSTKISQIKLLPVLKKLKSGYMEWLKQYQILPKHHRYTLGQKIDTLLIEAIESISLAGFLSKEDKQPYVRIAIRKMDTVKVLLLILWESKSIDNKKYIALSLPFEEVGKMLGGWNGQLAKSLDQNSR